MYTVKIYNNSAEKLLNEVSTKSVRRLSNALLTQSINAIDEFSFTVYANHPEYYNIREKQSRIKIFKGDSLIYSGYVIKIQEDMSGTGLITKQVVCESVLGYFYDSITQYWQTQDPGFTFVQFIQKVLDIHNSQVDGYKKINLGNIVNTQPTSNSFTLSYDKTFNVLKYITDRFGGEYRVRENDGKLYFDYDENGFGVKTEDTVIRVGRNLKTLNTFKDGTAVITRLYPFGAKIGENMERVNIADVNGWREYIEDSEAQKVYGIICGVLIDDEISEPSSLLTKARKYLAEKNKIRRTYTLTAIDLSAIGLDSSSFELYNRYLIDNPLINISEFVRVIKKTVDLNAPHLSSIEIGEKLQTVSEIAKEAQDNAKRQQEKMHSTANDIAVKVGADILSTANSNIQQAVRQAASDADSAYAKKDYVDEKIADLTLELNGKLTDLTAVIDGITARLAALEGN